MSNRVSSARFPAAANGSKFARFLTLFSPLILLTAVTLAAYANAWPNTLVHDDKFFTGSERFTGLQDVAQLFSEDLWAASGVRSGLYRPMLSLSLALDFVMYGNWMAGYHLNNIFLHLLATLLVFGLIRQLLCMTRGQSASVDRYALLAALVFSVHPVHTEVVNSIYNRSELLVAVGGTAGLWWFLYHLGSRPARAWTGLAVAYVFALFAKESAIVIPALAVVLTWIFTPCDWRRRLRICLPVIWLLLPLLLYLALRAQALEPPGGAKATDAAAVHAYSEIRLLADSGTVPGWRSLLKAAGFGGEALKAMLWPWPLLLFHGRSSTLWQWSSLALQLALFGIALSRYRKKRYSLIAGLAFFYIALLPASQMLGTTGRVPDIAERYLYFPSAGLAIPLAFGLSWVGHRFRFPVALAAVVLTVFALVPVCWLRNSDWASESALFESEYQHGRGGGYVLGLLTGAQLGAGNFARVIEICDHHPETKKRHGRFYNHCAIAYSGLGRNEEAERAFLLATRDRAVRTQAHTNLARFYLSLERREESKIHFERAIETESDPALRAYRNGELLVLLYPKDRSKLAAAKAHFEEALRLQPHMTPAQLWLERLNRVLGER